MSGDNIYVGKFIKGKEVVSTSSDGKIANFYFQDGTYECAPIIEGELIMHFDDITVSQETDYVDTEGEVIENIPGLIDGDLVEEPRELGLYKMLEAVPYTDEEGNETGKTEVGSVQEVPTDLGESWVALGLAEKIDVPKESVMDKVSNVISGILGNK